MSKCDDCELRSFYARAFDFHWMGEDDCPAPNCPDDVTWEDCVAIAPTIIPAEPFNNLSKPCKDDDDIPICTKASPASLGIYKKAEEGE